MMSRRFVLATCAVVSAAVGSALNATAAGFKSMTDVPVSACANTVYLSDMDGRLWWNPAWKKRAAILVSNMAKVYTSKTTIDFVFDVGEKIDPKSVRVTTPYEVEVPCVAERARDDASATAVNILFQTDLREMENRPFFVYWDNPDAQPAKIRNAFSIDVADDEVYVNNGCVETVFDNLHRTSGLIRHLKANGSPTQDTLLQRTTEYAWEGFSFETEKSKIPKADPGKVRPGNALDAQIHKPDVLDGWSKAIVTADNALKKTVTFTNAYTAVDFTFYAGEPRVDYFYRLAPGIKTATIGVSWACGGGTAHDDFYYPGLSGKVLTRRAALDHVTDSDPVPMEYYRYPWFGEGWYAFCDRRTKDVVGMLFDRESFVGPSYLAGVTHCGETARMRFVHKPAKGETATGSGALVASVGDYKIVANAYEMAKNRPRVFVGQTQPYREIKPYKRDPAHDWCVNFNVGGWKSAKPLDGEEWAANIANHLRSLGANTILLGQLTDYTWQDLPLSKDLYDRICAYAEKEKKNFKAPEFNKQNFSPKRLETICAAAHARGMAVTLWHGPIPGVCGYGDRYDPELQAINRELQPLYAQCGTDSIYNALAVSEGVIFPKEIEKKFGREYWKWDDPTPYFESRRALSDYMRKFYDHAHKVAPNARVMGFNSDNGELGREMCMPYHTGTMDTLFCEFVAGDDFDKIKHVAKRLRSYFDNEAGRTIHAHYYEMKLNYAARIFQNELPFICGINGFSNEAMTYENVEPENSQFQADFYRLAEHTRLGDKVAKMEPVKNLAVFRDVRCFEEDIRRKRTMTRSWWQASRQDLRVNMFSRIPSFSYDIVMNPFFKLDSLKRYKAIYIPDDEMLSEEDAATLLAFVKQGGGAVLTGASGEKVNFILKLQPGTYTQYGKGRIVWVKEVLTDRLIKNDAKAGEKIKALVASVGGVDPLTVSNPSLDGILQSSADGTFLGVYNRSATEQCGKVTINCPSSPSTAASASFVLDVRSGRHFQYADGFEITVGPNQCGFYLIGDEEFTALPKAAEAVWTGASAVSTAPAGVRNEASSDPDFKVRSCLEFVTPSERGGAVIERSEKAMLVRHRFCADEATMMKKTKADDFDSWMAKYADGVKCYTSASAARALGEAGYVHIQCDSADCDAMFADCKEELKSLLKRGGGILFMRTEPGPNARKFLEEIGVFNPWPSTKDGFQEPAVWSPNVSTNHPFCAAKGTWFNNNCGSSRKFAKWDVAKQYAPYVDKLQNEYALMVVQESVLGAGKVIFSHNRYCFTSWYENFAHGDAVLSFLLGMPVAEHAEKVTQMNGGPGKVVE